MRMLKRPGFSSGTAPLPGSNAKSGVVMKNLLILDHAAPLAEIIGFEAETWLEAGRLMFGSPEEAASSMAGMAGMDDESHDAIYAVIRYRGHTPPPDEFLPELARLLRRDGHLVLHITPTPSQKMRNALMRFMQANWFPSIGMADDDVDGLTAVACREKLDREAMKELLARHTVRKEMQDAAADLLRQSVINGF